MTDDLPLEERFERFKPEVRLEFFCDRRAVNKNLSYHGLLDTAGFLGRLWSRLGKPDEVFYGGFAYGLRDLQTGMAFVAGHGMGPSSGYSTLPNPEHPMILRRTLRAFENWLSTAPLVDCVLEVDTELGPWRWGVHDGKTFSAEIPLAPHPKEAKTVERVMEMVKIHGHGNDDLGFAIGLEETIPKFGVLKFPDWDDWMEYSDVRPSCFGLGVIAWFMGFEKPPFEVPVLEVPWPPLPETTLLWLRAYAEHGNAPKRAKNWRQIMFGARPHQPRPKARPTTRRTARRTRKTTPAASHKAASRPAARRRKRPSAR